MPKLTDTQLIILSKAAQDEGHIVTLPDKLKGGAAKKVVGKLLDLKYVEEIAAGRDIPVWRKDDNDRPIALRITKVGLEAIGVDDDPPCGSDAGARAASPNTRSNRRLKRGVRKTDKPSGPTKLAILQDRLACTGGATIAELSASTGWQAHSVRGAISGNLKKKRGLTVTSAVEVGRGRVYRLSGKAAVSR